MKRFIGTMMLIMTLSACGSRTDLRPKQGQSLPTKPAMAKVVPTPDELMKPDTQARPLRSDEQLIQTEKRRSDKFDIPPN